MHHSDIFCYTVTVCTVCIIRCISKTIHKRRQQLMRSKKEEGEQYTEEPAQKKGGRRRKFHHSPLRWRRTYSRESGSQMSIIQFAQKLLKAQLPRIYGLQCTLLSENNGFHTEQHESLQIYFVKGNRQVASSSFEQQVTFILWKQIQQQTPPITHSPAACIYRSTYKLLAVHCWLLKSQMFRSSLEAVTVDNSVHLA